MIDSRTKLPENRIHIFDPVGLINKNYGSYEAANYDIRTGRMTRSFDSFANINGGGLRFAVESTVNDESDPSSPPLWQTSPTSSPRVMSPNSRTQAIARGRKELIEMVRDMPESFYELSLKDIVEQKATLDAKHEKKITEEGRFVDEEGIDSKERRQKKSSKQMKKSESKGRMTRSGSIDNGGFLLKTSVFPISLGSKKTKRGLVTAASFKIPQQPTPAPISSTKGARDWWKRRSGIASDGGESGGLSSNSGSSSGSGGSNSRRRHSTRFFPSCCSLAVIIRALLSEELFLEFVLQLRYHSSNISGSRTVDSDIPECKII
ncbi:hypothetical protein Nepgr_018987 [Nepenthes gracilis]|uniref:Uncharacterized protein n=1 Tax=Nepenthes gracilis TaxID=150966 RepID=A0AAD3XUV8_NEPGR|nr:hypothetical protein Nepgr_018987 [Nepenthes gracilis]